jgi:hypothetical protein
MSAPGPGTNGGTDAEGQLPGGKKRYDRFWRWEGAAGSAERTESTSGALKLVAVASSLARAADRGLMRETPCLICFPSAPI